jgi:hypothetical protein
MEKHKFTITEWVFSESSTSFKINFSVASQETEDCEFYTLAVPYNFEEPTVFKQKVHNMMVLYVNNMRIFDECKEILSDLTFVETIRKSANNKEEDKEISNE